MTARGLVLATPVDTRTHKLYSYGAKDWETGHVQAESYRPISLLCTAAKIAEAIVSQRLQARLSSVLTKQYGYSPGISTAHAIGHILHQGCEAAADKMKVAIVKLDVSSAFNNVEHSRLIQELRLHRLDAFAEWLSGWLQHRTFSIDFEGHKTRTYCLGDRGIPNLPPILWAIYLDSLFAQPRERLAFRLLSSRAPTSMTSLQSLKGIEGPYKLVATSS